MKLTLIFLFLSLQLTAQIHTGGSEKIKVKMTGREYLIGSNASIPAQALLYDFDSIGGNIAYDKSVYNYDADIYLPAAEFGGNFYRYGTGTAIINGALTISCWIKGQSSNAIASGAGRGAESGTYDYLLGISNSSVAEFYIAVSATSKKSITANLNAADSNTWIHLMGVYIPSTSVKMYRNGVEIASSTTSVPASQYTHVANNFVIGALANTGSKFYGCMADVKVYNAAKTYSQVMANDTTGLVFWDMLNSAKIPTMGVAGDTTYAITGQKGGGQNTTYIGYNILHNLSRHKQGYTKVMYLNKLIYIPYSKTKTSQYNTYRPVFNAAETYEEHPFISNHTLHDWGEYYAFNNSDSLVNYADHLNFLYRPNDSSVLLRSDKLLSDIGDYYKVDTLNHAISSLKIYTSYTTYDSINVYALWGQSNMVGTCYTDPPDSLDGNLNTLIYTIAGIDTLNEDQHNNLYREVGYPAAAYSYGLELELSKELYRLTNKRNAFVKWAVGSTGINVVSCWDPNTKYQNMYDSLLIAVDDMNYWLARDYHLKPVLKGLVQYQGETDAITSGSANAYQTNLTAWYLAIRTYLGNLSLKAYVANIADLSHTYRETVRTAITNVDTADGNMFSLDARDYTLKVDNLHHDCTGYINLGKGLAVLINSNP